jgi:dsRNA-specific ribonuclease
MANPTQSEILDQLRQDAWVGDAVLELYVRSHILRTHGRVDAEMKTRFTCNQFLNCVGNPTKVEAEIGVIYQKDGLEAAFTWISQTLEPLFMKQEAKRTRTGKA